VLGEAVIKKDKLRWFSHVKHKDDTDWIKMLHYDEGRGSEGIHAGRMMSRTCSFSLSQDVAHVMNRRKTKIKGSKLLLQCT